MQNTDESDPHERLVRQLDWNLLRTFIAIVRYGGISRAAEHIHLTQPAVSQGLKRLEAQLNCKLIERNTRQFEITETGRRIYAKSLEIHTQISRLGDVTLEDKDEISGHVRLLLVSRIKSQILDDLLFKFCQQYPRISLRIDVLPSVEVQGLIQQGSACAGFCLMRGDLKDVKTKLLLREYFGLYCGPKHKLFGRSDLSTDALRHENFITFPSDQIGGVLSPLTIYREQHLYEGQVIAASHNLDEIIRLTELGLGIGIIPVHEAKSRVKKNELWRLPPHDDIGPVHIHLIWNASAETSKAEQTFLEFSQDYLERQIHPETT